MSTDALQIIAPNPKLHREELIDLIAKTFSIQSYFNMRDYCEGGFFDGSHYDWNASRIGLLDGRIVTHYGVWGYTMRIGCARVRVGGIGAVATHGNYRKRGLMGKTAPAVVEAMRATGYDLSLLFGIPDFYHKFGYVRAWSESRITIATRDLPSEKPAARLRTFSPAHRDDLATLYNKENKLITGTAVRPTYQRMGLTGITRGYRWSENGGGYLVYRVDGERLQHIDSAGDANTVLRLLGFLARRESCHEACFFGLPAESPLGRLIRRGNCREEIEHHRNASALARVINLPSTLEKMRPEFARRLCALPGSGWHGSLLIDNGKESACLNIDGAEITVGISDKTSHAIRGNDEIVQLILGTGASETAGTTLEGDAPLLLPILFPRQYPMLGAWDRF